MTQRIGQFIFNGLVEKFPEVVCGLAGTEKDCFYNDEKTIEFICEVIDRLLKEKEDGRSQC